MFILRVRSIKHSRKRRVTPCERYGSPGNACDTPSRTCPTSWRMQHFRRTHPRFSTYTLTSNRFSEPTTSNYITLRTNQYTLSLFLTVAVQIVVRNLDMPERVYHRYSLRRVAWQPTIGRGCVRGVEIGGDTTLSAVQHRAGSDTKLTRPLDNQLG